MFGMTKKDQPSVVMLNLGRMEIRLVSASPNTGGRKPNALRPDL